jgi:hypothetical protein
MSEPFNPQTATATTATQTATRPKPSIWPVDIALGALVGDFAKVLGVPGYLTQGILGFVPVVGTCCAARDLLANWAKRDGKGVLLNAISLVPVAGGISKMAHVMRGIKSASQVAGTSDNVVRAVFRG